MITALTSLLVLVSLGLVVTVPVALATPGEWENSKEGYLIQVLQLGLPLFLQLPLLMELQQHFK